jgi:type 1 glutamine amidotransferase
VFLSGVVEKFLRRLELLTTTAHVICRRLLLACCHVYTVDPEGNNCLCGMHMHGTAPLVTDHGRGSDGTRTERDAGPVPGFRRPVGGIGGVTAVGGHLRVMVSVLVLGENTFPFHEIEEKANYFESVLDGHEVTVSTDRDDLTGEYDVLVDYLTDSTLTDAQLDALLAHVEAGGGYVGVHCASDLTSTYDPDDLIDSREEPFPELRELIGGHFLTHPEQSEFTVEVTGEHPVVAGVADFSVFDEPYQVEVDDDVRVLARMDHPDLESYPVVWTNESAGRVAYVSLGHTDEAFETDAFRRILENAVSWATGDA